MKKKYMDDEQILNRGGDEYDIREYAKQNGANLTRDDVLSLRALFKRQDEEFEEKFGSVLYKKDANWSTGYLAISKTVKSYITQSKLEVVKAMMEEIRRTIVWQISDDKERLYFDEVLTNLQSELNEIEKTYGNTKYKL